MVIAKDKGSIPRTNWEHLTTSVCGWSIVISNPAKQRHWSAKQCSGLEHLKLNMSDISTPWWIWNLCYYSPSVCNTTVSSATSSCACCWNACKERSVVQAHEIRYPQDWICGWMEMGHCESTQVSRCVSTPQRGSFSESTYVALRV